MGLRLVVVYDCSLYNIDIIMHNALRKQKCEQTSRQTSYIIICITHRQLLHLCRGRCPLLAERPLQKGGTGRSLQTQSLQPLVYLPEYGRKSPPNPSQRGDFPLFAGRIAPGGVPVVLCSGVQQANVVHEGCDQGLERAVGDELCVCKRVGE